MAKKKSLIQERKELGDQICDREKYAAMEGEEAIKERMSGRQPMIDIAGHLFFIDVRLGLLRPKDDFMNPGLNLDTGGNYDERKEKYEFYYHVPTKTEYEADRDITEFPKDVVLIQFPGKYALDPIGMATKLNYDPNAFLTSFPVIMMHQAKVIPLEKSYMAELIRRNREEQGLKNSREPVRKPGQKRPRL